MAVPVPAIMDELVYLYKTTTSEGKKLHVVLSLMSHAQVVAQQEEMSKRHGEMALEVWECLLLLLLLLYFLKQTD
jgi:hypothetical protein